MSPIQNLDDLNAMHMDVLKEIGNIGSGSAASALSTLLNAFVDISVPSVKCLDFDETINFIGGAEELVIGLMIRFTGEISGIIMYILKKEFFQKVINAFYPKEIDDLTQLDDMDRSAVSEVGNIMAGSYVNAISSLSGLTIDISVPAICIDYAGAILSVPAVEYASLGDKVLFIDDNFKIESEDIKSNMILIPEMDSLTILFSKLGIEI
ncbi:MAG: chemotaxis protein CheC [Oscillospiraceae bacterium]|jgi:chemotaxis protein CheC